MLDGEEHRHGRRLVVGSPVEVQVVSRPDRFCWRRPVMVSHVRDISACGMQVQVEAAECVPVGSVMRIRIQMQEGGQTEVLPLRGVVVWFRAQPDNGFMVGLKLSDRPRKVVARWQAVIFEEIRHRDLTV